MSLVIILLLVIAFIVVATTKFKLHPFVALLLAAFIAAFAYQLPVNTITGTISNGVGGLLGQIGLVIVLGTIIGTVLEKSGAAITMAEFIIKLLGQRFPTLTMSIIGYIVSVPVFCDSGFVILNSLKESMAKRMSISPVAMSVALATGLYATHTFVPPTPGPIAAAGNLGLEDNLGLVIVIGIFIAAAAAIAGMLWANRFANIDPDIIDEQATQLAEVSRESYGELPSAGKAFAPIFIPILLICLGSIANLPSRPFADGALFETLLFLGTPLNALIVGLLLSIRLIKGDKRIADFSERVSEGLTSAAPILLITGAGGAFGAVLKATELGNYLGTTLSALGIGLFMPFIVAAALKTAQGSSTVALVTTSALVAPMLAQLGLDSEMGRVLTVMAIGAGAMTVSHANDSFFWVVSQFGKMSVSLAYRAQTIATLVQGCVVMLLTYLLSLFLL